MKVIYLKVIYSGGVTKKSMIILKEFFFFSF